MKFHKIVIKNEGYISCKSNFYCAKDVLDMGSEYTLHPGINKLIGDIDSGNWAVSYLLSMYKNSPNDFVLFDEPSVVVNNHVISLNEVSEHACYLDRVYPLFATDYTVKQLILQGLEYSKLNFSYTDVKDMFQIDNDRFERSLASVGNEIFKAMSAIGFSYNKEIFCFPWLSSKRFNSYHENLSVLLQILAKLGKIVIVPVGVE